jgi:integrase
VSPRKIPGSVFARGRKWAYKFYGAPDPLTGKKEPISKSGFESEDEAWEAMTEAQREVSKGTYTAPSSATVSAFFHRWFSMVRTTTEPTTATNYENLANAYVLPLIGNRLMRDLTPDVVSALYERLLVSGRRKKTKTWDMFQRWSAGNAAGQPVSSRQLAEEFDVTYSGAWRAIQRFAAGHHPQLPTAGLAKKTVHSVHIMLHAAMPAAVTWKFVTSNPMVGVKAPSVDRKGHTTWSPVEMTRFLDTAWEDRFCALWVLVATTGMRRSELCGLRRDSLDLAAASVRVRSTRVIAGAAVHTGGGKSRRSRRRLALDDMTVTALRKHLDAVDRERDQLGAAYIDEGYVFCWEDGRPIYPGTISDRFDRLVQKAGVPRIPLHGVRHSYATIALSSGVHPKIVSSRLGHATVAFTLDSYSEDVPDLDRAAAGAISALFLRADRERPEGSGEGE